MSCKYSRALNKILRFAADKNTLNQLAAGMTHADWAGVHPDADHTKRGVFADAYEEHTGDSNGANALRDPKTPVHWDGTTAQPGVLKRSSIARGRHRQYWEQPEPGDVNVKEDGPAAVLNRFKDNPPVGKVLFDWSGSYPEGTKNKPETHTVGEHSLDWHPSNPTNWTLWKTHILPAHQSNHQFIRPDGTTSRSLSDPVKPPERET